MYSLELYVKKYFEHDQKSRKIQNLYLVQSFDLKLKFETYIRNLVPDFNQNSTSKHKFNNQV